MGSPGWAGHGRSPQLRPSSGMCVGIWEAEQRLLQRSYGEGVQRELPLGRGLTLSPQETKRREQRQDVNLSPKQEGGENFWVGLGGWVWVWEGPRVTGAVGPGMGCTLLSPSKSTLK